MSNWLLENWQGLLGGTSLSTVVQYIINRKSNKADLLDKVQTIYEKWVKDSDKRQEEAKEHILELKETINQYSEDFRNIRKAQDTLQSQFNDLNISYTKEVEKSQYWMQKYDELDKKYNELVSKHDSVIEQNKHLEKLCEDLKSAHDKLQREFDTHKRKTANESK